MKQLFPKGSFLGGRVVILVLLSLVLMVSDHRWHYFSKVRSALSIVIVPVQYLVSAPVNLIDQVDDYFSSKHRLLKENASLRNKQLLLQVKVQKFIALEQENAQLRALLSSSAKINNQVLAAQLLAVTVNPFDQQVVLNKGRRRGVYVGQPLLDAYGIMGQVIEVGPFTSRALLITSSRSAVPVQDNRSGVRAIAVGTGLAGELRLLHVQDTADVKAGDLLVSSGLGLRFPVGYPVGTVKSVAHTPGERFANITITPTAKVNRSRQVLLVWSRQVHS